MSLFGSIQLANNSLRAAQIGLQVVGQNIANASTPGYIREEAIFVPAPTQKKGNLLQGLGVEVKGIVQKIDNFLEDRLRGAISDRTSSEVQEQTYLQLEGLIGELSNTDLSTALTKFFNSISEIVNQPEDLSVRNLAVMQGQSLAADIQRLSGRVVDNRADLNQRIVNIADDINRLTEEIRTLNIRIASVEGGDISGSEAVGLRDQRLIALTKLSELVDIRVAEQPSGAVAVFTSGEFLVFEGHRREVAVSTSSDRGTNVATIQIAETLSPVSAISGELAGLIRSRDEFLGGFLDKLNDLAGTMIHEFNKVFSQGQGLTGFSTATSTNRAFDLDAPLNEAGLPFAPRGGGFELVVFNRTTNQINTTQIPIDLDGIGADTSLSDLAAAIDAVSGVTATISSTGLLTIASESVDAQFSFSGDTSGVLAALGINTFFTGASADTIGVNGVLVDDPSKFAAGLLADPQTGVALNLGENNLNAIELVRFLDKPLDSKNGSSLLVLYNRMTAEVTQGSTVAQSVAEGFRVFEETLQGQKLATSGVSLDEEAIKMISYQRMFQASARYIATLDELLELLVTL